MRFMSIVTSAHTDMPTPELMEAMGKLADREIKAGRMIDMGGLMPLATGAQVRIRDGELSVIDGPFVEAKEVIGGYAIFEFRNKEEALASAVEFMQLHRQHMPGWEGTCEVRAMAGPEIRGARPARSPRSLTPDALDRAIQPAAMTAAGNDRAHQTILAVWRNEQPRLITSLARMLRDVPLAEDLTQEALLAALEHWPATGVPEKPGAWLMATAKRRALDHLRRGRMLARKHGDGCARSRAGAAGDARFRRRARRRHRRRIAAADLHRLPSASVARGPRGAGAADDLRPDHRRDRAGLPACRMRPSPSASCAPSGRCRNPGSPTRRRAARSCRSGSPRCWRSSISSSTKAIPPRAATTGCARSSATRRCAWPACSPRSRRRSPKPTACWR